MNKISTARRTQILNKRNRMIHKRELEETSALFTYLDTIMNITDEVKEDVYKSIPYDILVKYDKFFESPEDYINVFKYKLNFLAQALMAYPDYKDRFLDRWLCAFYDNPAIDENTFLHVPTDCIIELILRCNTLMELPYVYTWCGREFTDIEIMFLIDINPKIYPYIKRHTVMLTKYALSRDPSIYDSLSEKEKSYKSIISFMQNME